MLNGPISDSFMAKFSPFFLLYGVKSLIMDALGYELQIYIELVLK